MHDSQDFIGQAYYNYQGVLLEYCYLAVQSELSDEEGERLGEILVRAESNPVLNFLLSEIDYTVGQLLGLGDAPHVEEYENQQAWLREHLRPEDTDHHRKLQELLQKVGHYKGPVDGVFGKESRMAVEAFQRSVFGG